MERVFKCVLVAGALVTFGFGCILPTPRADAASKVDRRSNLTSRAVYVNNCARCHGADGRGDTELGRLNDVPDISGGRARRMGNAGLTRVITRGKGSMPGFSKKLNKKQIVSVVSYVRGL